MTKQSCFVNVMCLLICSLNLVAGDVQPTQKFTGSMSATSAATSGARQTTIRPEVSARHVHFERSAARSTASASQAQRAKRRSKQVIIVIVVDDQESSWI